MKTHEAISIVNVLRRIATLQGQARKLRKKLKENEQEQRQLKKQRNGMVAALQPIGPDVAPSPLFGGAVGYKIEREK